MKCARRVAPSKRVRVNVFGIRGRVRQANLGVSFLNAEHFYSLIEHFKVYIVVDI